MARKRKALTSEELLAEERNELRAAIANASELLATEYHVLQSDWSGQSACKALKVLTDALERP